MSNTRQIGAPLRVIGAVIFAALGVACSQGHSADSESFVAEAVRKSACDPNTAHSVGRVYFALNPYYELTQPRNVEAFIRKNATLLAADGQVIQCARVAAQRLAALSIRSFDARAANDAYSMSMSQGATMEQANAVKDSINEGSVQTLIVAEELAWLANVIPAAAAGDFSPFRGSATDARQMLRQAWPMYQQLLSINPENRAIVDQVFQAYQPWLEYQISYLVYASTT